MMVVKKNYLRFASQIVALIIATTFIVFFAITFLVNKNIDWSSDIVPMLQTVLSICFVVSAIVLVMGAFSFFVKVDETGVKKGLGAKVIPWSEIDYVKVIGIPSVSYFNRMIVSGRGQNVEVKLFIFDDQISFIESVKFFLPWASNLSITHLPSEAHRYKKELNKGTE